MKSLLALTFTVLTAAASAAEIPAGTSLLLRMEHSVGSRTANVGDSVHLRTVTPISTGQRIVVPVGSYAHATVVRVQHAKRGHVRGELEFRLVRLVLPSGEVFEASSKVASVASDESQGAYRRSAAPFPRVPFAGVFGLALAGAIAGGQTGARAGLLAGGAVAVISAIAARGSDVELRQGTMVDVVLDRAASVE